MSEELRAGCRLGNTDYRCRRDVPYGDHALQTYDLWLPNGATAPTPLVVYIHGGGYVGGDKSSAYQGSFDAQALLDAGFAFATLDYRLAGDFPYQRGVTGEFPAAMADAARALQSLRAGAARNRIDPSRVAVTGVSAGGGISLWLAFHDDLRDPSSADPVARLSTRVRCAAVTETQTTLDIREVDALLGDSFELGEGIPALYGLTPSEYTCDPAGHDARLAESYFEASPISHLSADDEARIFLRYALPAGTGNIHGAEFGTYLATGQPLTLARRFGRTNLAALGVDASMRVTGSPAQSQREVSTFLTTRCFQ